MTQDKPVLVQVREALQLAQHTFCETHQRMIFSGQIKPERSKYANALALLDAFIESVPDGLDRSLTTFKENMTMHGNGQYVDNSQISPIIDAARILNNAVKSSSDDDLRGKE